LALAHKWIRKHLLGRKKPSSSSAEARFAEGKPGSGIARLKDTGFEAKTGDPSSYDIKPRPE
jgi:hypothetical protein